jgi:mRNA interferase RelE/StbE
MFEVILSPEAQRFYTKADKPLGKKLMRCFQQLESDPHRHNNIKRLSGALSAYSRYRIGDWRVIFRIDDDRSRVYVASIASRSEVYE